ncbi:MAG: hypothetical protein M1817_001488 [Caeruleum heppii]|nr:MAG: hypothetical protein M1817_001488 [Caeruleum heppii]
MPPTDAPPSSSSPSSPASPPSETTPPPTLRSRLNTADLTSPRSLRQLSLFVGGTTFFLLSTVITRRSLHRRRLLATPAFYHPSHAPPVKEINGGLEAFEALNIATINVTSFMVMVTGGLLWAFDISGMADLRRKVRGAIGTGVGERSEQDAEEEMEEWLATVLARKEMKEGVKKEVEKLKNEERKR